MSSFMWWTYFGSSLVSAVAAILLVLHSDYIDGIVGRFALVTIVFVSALQLHDAYSGFQYDGMLPVVWLEHVALALFLLWNYIRHLVHTRKFNMFGG